MLSHQEGFAWVRWGGRARSVVGMRFTEREKQGGFSRSVQGRIIRRFAPHPSLALGAAPSGVRRRCIGVVHSGPGNAYRPTLVVAPAFMQSRHHSAMSAPRYVRVRRFRDGARPARRPRRSARWRRVGMYAVALVLAEDAAHAGEEFDSACRLLGCDGDSAMHDEERGGVRQGGRVDRGARLEVGAAEVRFAESVGKGTKRTPLELNAVRGSVAPRVLWMTSMRSSIFNLRLRRRDALGRRAFIAECDGRV